MANNVYEEAAEAYVQVMNTATEMFKVHQQSMEEKGKQFSVRVALNQLDVIIQYSMLQVALNDNDLDKNEVMFIKEMSQYCDFCSYLNQRGYQNVTWEVIFNSDINSLKEVLEESKKDVISLAEDFINVFSVIDAMTPDHNYLDDLYKQFCTIIAAVMQADGKAYKEEVSNGCLLVDLIAIINEQKNRVENDINENKRQAAQPNAKRSLKDYYVKKN